MSDKENPDEDLPTMPMNADSGRIPNLGDETIKRLIPMLRRD